MDLYPGESIQLLPDQVLQWPRPPTEYGLRQSLALEMAWGL